MANTKYAMVVPDGCADEPLESLGGKTPLAVAETPAMDEIARDGRVGRARHVPEGFSPGSDVANLSLFGYDPRRYFTGRAPLEAASLGIDLAPGDWAFRCNMVTIRDGRMIDFTAGHISTEESAVLLSDLQSEIGSEHIEFVPGTSYRNILVYRSMGEAPPFSLETRGTPPHDLTNSPVMDDYPRGPGSDILHRLMAQSVFVFADHPINRAREAKGKPPATSAWLWGAGSTPRLDSFEKRFTKRGAIITGVDLLRGLAALVGWRRIDVPGATGYTDTNYAGKGEYAVAAIEETDLIFVHVEATDEAAHEGDVEAKIKALENIDRHIVGPLYAALRHRGDYRIMVTPDHPTPIRTRTHTRDPVPLAMAGKGIDRDAAARYDEATAGESDWIFENGSLVMPYFLGIEEGIR